MPSCSKILRIWRPSFYIYECSTPWSVALRQAIFKWKKGCAIICLGLNCCSMGSSQPVSRDTLHLSQQNYPSRIYYYGIFWEVWFLFWNNVLLWGSCTYFIFKKAFGFVSLPWGEQIRFRFRWFHWISHLILYLHAVLLSRFFKSGAHPRPNFNSSRLFTIYYLICCYLIYCSLFKLNHYYCFIGCGTLASK
jgi:hypothetical protein